MNDQVVFSKTPAGEEAIRARERLVQRNLRTVLIVVDGMADVATLKRSIGDAAMVESALLELQRMGLITTPPSPGGEAAGAAISAEAAPVAEPRHADTEGLAIFQEPVAPESSSAVGEPAQPTDPASISGVGNPGWWSKRGRRHSDADEEELYERAYGAEDHTQIAMPGRTAQDGMRTSLRKRRFKAWPIAAIGFATAAVLAILRVVLYPYDEYRPAFEEGLSRALDDAVTIDAIHVNFMPWPVIVLEKVRIGKTPYATVEVARMLPEASSLITGMQRYGDVHLEGIRMTDASLKRISRWFNPDRMGDARVKRLLVDRLTFDFGKASVGELKGSADIDPEDGLRRVVLHAKGDDLMIEAEPGPAGVSIAISATGWRMPSKPPVLLPTFNATGQLAPGLLKIDALDARAYDGIVTGDASITWGSGARAAIKLNLQNVVAGKLLDALGGPPLVDGLVNGRLDIEAKAETPNRLADDLRLIGAFKVVRGGLRNIDLAEALKASSRRSAETIHGGRTDFEEFAASLAVDTRTIRVTGARLSSGLLSATGQATIARQAGTISGSTTVGLHASGLQRHATIAIAGRAASPELRAGR